MEPQKRPYVVSIFEPSNQTAVIPRLHEKRSVHKDGRPRVPNTAAFGFEYISKGEVRFATVPKTDSNFLLLLYCNKFFEGGGWLDDGERQRKKTPPLLGCAHPPPPGGR